jgi:hypothetical protein
VFIASDRRSSLPRNVQTREERVKLVYAARVQVVGDPAFELKPGMPADVRLLLGGRDGPSGGLAPAVTDAPSSDGADPPVRGPDGRGRPLVRGGVRRAVRAGGPGRPARRRRSGCWPGSCRPRRATRWWPATPWPGNRTGSDPTSRTWPSGSGLYEELTVLENLQFYADLYRVPRRSGRPAWTGCTRSRTWARSGTAAPASCRAG